jgi:hypothetical protein
MTDVADITYDAPPNGRTVNSLAAYVANNAVFNVCDYGAVGDGATDDTTAIQAASTACNAAGGGILYFPIGTYLISGAVTVTRLVNVLGAGANVTTITAASIQPFKVVGATLSWAGNTIQDIGFQTVDVYLGTLVTDFGTGAQIINCLFRNCTYSIYFGFNCFFTRVERCEFVDSTYGSFVDQGTAGTTSGAMMRWRDCEFHDSGSTGLSHVGICLSGAAISGYDLYVNDCEFERLTIGAVQVIGGTNRAYLSLRDIHFELMGTSAYHIINDGAIIKVDGFWSFSATEAAWIYSSGGRTSLARGFGNWTSQKFAKTTGGVIQVDPDSIYCPLRWWGNGVQLMTAAGSTASGLIVGPRTPFLAQSFVTTGSLTDASPAATPIVVAVPNDANVHVYEGVVNVTVITGTNNYMRFQIADGATSINVDFAMPLFVGLGRFRVTWAPGGKITGEMIFSGSTPGATTSKGVFVAPQSDTTLISNIRYLNISTIKSGSTCATMTVEDLMEYVSGPYIADT